MFTGRVGGADEAGLGPGFVLATANNAGRLNVELGEIDTGVDILGVELHGALKLFAGFAGETDGCQEVRPGRFFSIDVSHPAVIPAVIRLKRDCPFAGGFGAIKLLEGEISAAKQVGRFSVGRG